ncbi:MAG: DUF5615 family PIN-like protein [Microcystaceae cyanobacterium]|nr:DUF5615 family PIN-like protein [Merismopediaceae bacterium]
MTRICLYLDEDAIDEDFIQALRSHQVDVLTVKDTEMLHQSDEQQLAWATENRRVLFSFNTKDFYQLHTQYLQNNQSHSGIILAPQQRYSIGELLRGILNLMNAKSLEEIEGKIEFISHWV